MNKSLQTTLAAFAFSAIVADSACAQYQAPPPTAAEMEAAYTVAIDKRTTDIVAALTFSDTTKSNKIYTIIIAQYRALRARDDAAAARAKAAGKETAAAERQEQTQKLQAEFLAKLSAELTPEQIVVVKDKLTYGKLKVTYDAYCVIIPRLTDQDKAKILELLGQARDEAISGGSAGEKSDIFQKYKDQINAYLNANGHDVEKAYEEWNKKQEAEAATASK